MIVSCNFPIFNLGLSENVEKTKKKIKVQWMRVVCSHEIGFWGAPVFRNIPSDFWVRILKYWNQDRDVPFPQKIQSVRHYFVPVFF